MSGLADDVLPTRVPESGLLRGYLAAGSRHGTPLCLSADGTGHQVPDGLLDRLRAVPRQTAALAPSPYGLPALREAAGPYLTRTHRLAGVAQRGRDYEVAPTWTGTRTAMAAFGRYLLAELGSDGRVPVAVTAGPSWDYDGVLRGLGYRVRYVRLCPETGFRPLAEDLLDVVDRVLSTPDERLAMVIVNAQHNPTAVNWRPEFVATAVDTAHRHGAGVLVDDAYFGVHDPGAEPTSALRVLLSRLPAAPPSARRRWLGVRSLGKQFHCPGWGLGLLTAEPATLDLLVTRHQPPDALRYGAVHQHAMASWLSDQESDTFLAEHNADYEAKRLLVDRRFRARLGYPAGTVHTGTCTSSLMFALPPAYRTAPTGATAFRDDCFHRTGVLFALAWPWPSAPISAQTPYLRLNLGPDPRVLEEAVARLVHAEIHYDMPAHSIQ